MIKTILFDFGNVVAFFDHQRAIRQLLPHTDRTPEQLIEAGIVLGEPVGSIVSN